MQSKTAACMVGLEKSGSPTDPMNSMVKCRQTAKTLSKEQRSEVAKRREDKVEKIMKARNDQKTFYKIIKNQLKSSNSHLQTILVNNKEYETQDQIRGIGRPLSEACDPLREPPIRSGIQTGGGPRCGDNCDFM